MDNEILVEYCENLKKIQEMNGIDEKSVIIETSENKIPQKLIDTKEGRNIFEKTDKIGFVAENEFKNICIKSDLIAIRIEQTLENYRRQYKKVFKFVKRPDFYILGKDVFVEVKAKNLDNPSLEKCFFSIKKDDLEGYRTFQDYANKKIYFACFPIWEPDEDCKEYREILEDELAMIDMDEINSENKNVIDKGSYFLVKKEAFKDGITLLLE